MGGIQDTGGARVLEVLGVLKVPGMLEALRVPEVFGVLEVPRVLGVLEMPGVLAALPKDHQDLLRMLGEALGGAGRTWQHP